MTTNFFSPENLRDRSFFMTAENAETVRNMSEPEFRKHARKELATLKLQTKVVKAAFRAKRKAMRKLPFNLSIESARDGIGTVEKCRAVLAERDQKMKTF
jgi:hypothetical protein